MLAKTGSWRAAALVVASLFVSRPQPILAANPFLSASDNRAVSAPFHGAEWGDEIPQDEIALTARVVTTQVARMSWGAIFKIEFLDLHSHAARPREIPPDYYVVTEERIILLNEENMPEAIKRTAEAPKPPASDPGEIYGITHGTFHHVDGPWETTIEVKGDLCTYHASHHSGHFKTVVWKKGVGLVEYSSGRGAMADGFRLKRQSP